MHQMISRKIIFQLFFLLIFENKDSNSINFIKKQPNIILFLADDFGYGDLSIYGHPSQEWTKIDDLARNGIRFTNFHTSFSVCTPSRASLLTGRLSTRSGVIGNSMPVFLPAHSTGLPKSEITLAEALKGQGYRTGMVGKWHLGINQFNYSDGLHLPYYHGFDYVGHILPFTLTDDCQFEGRGRRTNSFLYRNTTIVQQPIDLETLSEKLLTDAEAFIYDHSSTDKENKRPFFLYYSLPQTHIPMFNRREFIGKSKRGIYGQQILEISWQVERIVNLLEKEHLENDTLVIFTSDHGPHIEICGHGGNAGPFRGGKGTSYEGGVRIPAIAYWPGVIKRGQVSSEMWNLMDLYTTLISLSSSNKEKTNLKFFHGIVDGFNNIDNLLDAKQPTLRQSNLYFHNDQLTAIQYLQYKMHFYAFDLRPDEIAKNCINGNYVKDWFKIPIECDLNQMIMNNKEHCDYGSEKLHLYNLYDLNSDPGETVPLNVDIDINLQDIIKIIQSIIEDYSNSINSKKVEKLLSMHFYSKKLSPCCNIPYCSCK